MWLYAALPSICIPLRCVSLTSSYIGSWLCRSFFDVFGVFVTTHFLLITQIIINSNPSKIIIKITPERISMIISRVLQVKPVIMHINILLLCYSIHTINLMDIQHQHTLDMYACHIIFNMHNITCKDRYKRDLIYTYKSSVIVWYFSVACANYRQ